MIAQKLQSDLEGEGYEINSVSVIVNRKLAIIDGDIDIDEYDGYDLVKNRNVEL